MSASLHRAAAYGLTFISDEPIPGLPPRAEAAGDPVRVHLRTLPLRPRDQSPPGARRLFPTDDGPERSPVTVYRLEQPPGYLFRYTDGTDFLIAADGSAVWASWTGAATLEDTATYLLGPIVSFLLRLRDAVPLHASGIILAGGVVGLAGASGAGKSTTAAAFGRAGVPVFADDTLALRSQDGRIWVDPAHAFVRLWPESVELIFGRRDALPPLTPNWDKRYLDLGTQGGQAGAQRLPLRALYFLGERSTGPAAGGVRAVPPREAMVLLVTNTSANQFLDAELRRAEFILLDEVVRRVPVRFVTPHADPSRLPELLEIIHEDTERLQDGAGPGEPGRDV